MRKELQDDLTLVMNDARQAQAMTIPGNVVVTAGPGTGKTKFLTVRLATLLANEVRSPRGIACITHSNECARELKKRLARYGITGQGNVFIGTVHTWCFLNIILPYAHLAGQQIPQPIAVATENEQRQVWSSVLPHEDLKDWQLTQLIARHENLRSRNPIRGTAWLTNFESEREAILAYEAGLRSHGLIDFHDMVIMSVNMVKENTWLQNILCATYQYIAIDEYQDLGSGIHELVMALYSTGKTRFIVAGDVRQSIYGFSGARPELMTQLAHTPGFSKIEFKTNYRSSTKLVELAANVSPTKLESTAERTAIGTYETHQIRGDCRAQAAFVIEDLLPKIGAGTRIQWGQIGIIYNNKREGAFLSASLQELSEEIPYVRRDNDAPYRKSPLTRWIEDCAAWSLTGWRTGKPSLDEIAGMWMTLNGNKKNAVEQQRETLDLVTFLRANRNEKQSAREWSSSFEERFLASRWEAQPLLRSYRPDFEKFEAAIGPTGEYSAWTLGDLAGQCIGSNRLVLSTIHGSKGLEFDVVILLLGPEEADALEHRVDDESQALNKMFVAITRAKDELYVCTRSEKW